MSTQELALGITKEQLAGMLELVARLHTKNNAIGSTHVRRQIDRRLVEIHLLLRDGHLDNIGKS